METYVIFAIGIIFGLLLGAWLRPGSMRSNMLELIPGTNRGGGAGEEGQK